MNYSCMLCIEMCLRHDGRVPKPSSTPRFWLPHFFHPAHSWTRTRPSIFFSFQYSPLRLNYAIMSLTMRNLGMGKSPAVRFSLPIRFNKIDGSVTKEDFVSDLCGLGIFGVSWWLVFPLCVRILFDPYCRSLFYQIIEVYYQRIGFSLARSVLLETLAVWRK